MGGAFCSTITPTITPYVLLNYDGMYRDISTMAHEFGHAIHSICSFQISQLLFRILHYLSLKQLPSLQRWLLNEKFTEEMTEQEKSLFL